MKKAKTIDFEQTEITLNSGQTCLVASLSCSGKKVFKGPDLENEDRIFTSPELFGVFDGATAVIEGRLAGLTPGAWLAEESRLFLAGLDNPTQQFKTAKELLIALNRHIQKQMSANFPEMWEALPCGPSASGALGFIRPDGTCSFAAAGDCVIVAISNTGIQQLTEDLISTGEIAFFTDALQSKIEATREMHQERRKERYNKTFACINGDALMEDNHHLIQSGEVTLSDLEALIILTDGMGLPASTEAEYVASARKIAELNYDLPTYLRHLIDFYDQDPDCTIYPRGKHFDDASGVVFRFTK